MGTRFFVRGRRALVTGAASGIGRATAFELARRGASVELVDLDAARLEEVARHLRARGSRASAHVVDVADARAVEALAARLVRDGPIDLLVNNAGVAVVAPFAATTGEDWDWIVGVNVWGPLRLTRALLPAMAEQHAGHVVVVASMAGLVGAPGMVAYTTTKFAMVGFAEALRVELADAGIGVTTVCPGYVRTGLHASTRYGNPGFQRFLDQAPSFYGMSAERVASAIADGVEARRPRVVLGPEKIGWYLKRLAPEAAYAISRWVARRTGIAAQ
jgi:short-subunit dehydrogenase